MTYELTEDCPWGKSGDVFREATGCMVSEIHHRRIIDTDYVYILRKLGVLVEVKEEVWPQEGDRYYYVDSFGEVTFSFWYERYFHSFRRDTGNMFRTEEEALSYREKLLTKKD